MNEKRIVLEAPTNVEQKISQNQPCPCGAKKKDKKTRKKYKHCCGRKRDETKADSLTVYSNSEAEAKRRACVCVGTRLKTVKRYRQLSGGVARDLKCLTCDKIKRWVW